MTHHARRLFPLFAPVLLAACSGERSAVPDARPSPSLDIARRFTRASGASALPPGVAELARVGDRIHPTFARAPAAEVSLPMRAHDRAAVVDAASGLGVDLALAGAADVPALLDGGHVVYERALGDAVLIQRPTPEGLEDFLVLERAPAMPISYAVHLREGVAGVRLVGRTMELVDHLGVPRLRMEPPYVVGADHRRSPVGVTLSGCDYDRDPASPYGRPPVPPGARDCTLRLDLPDVAFPALLDPGWKSTKGTMAVARAIAQPSLLPDGRVLLAGGVDESMAKALAEAEIFDPKTGTFAVTGSLAVPRLDPHLTLLDDGRVLVFGGHDDGTFGAGPTAELYDAKTGLFSAAASAPEGRDAAFSLKVPDGRVLYGGGCKIPVGSSGCSGPSLASTVFYDPKHDTWAPGPMMKGRRHAAAATRLLTGEILVAGGDIDASNAADTAEVLDASYGAFHSVGGFPVARERASATLFPDGRVLIAGGFGFDDIGNAVAVAQTSVYLPASGAFIPGPAFPTGVYSHFVALLPSGTLALLTGTDVDGTPLAVQLGTGLDLGPWKPYGTPAATPRYAALVAMLDDSTVLVAGGKDIADAVLQSAEIFADTCVTQSNCGAGYCSTAGVCAAKKALGGACEADLQCDGGPCVDGVCCNTACAGQCEACDVVGAVGMCTPVTGPAHPPRMACSGTGPCAGACDGVERSGCSYPDGKVSCASSCATDGSNVFTSGACDATGACATKSISCGSYACGATACLSSCTKDADCTSGFACDTGTCMPKQGPTASCADDGHTLHLADGTAVDCAPYACTSPGVCLTTCDNSQQCVSGSACNAARACTPKASPAADDGGGGGCGCAVPARSPSGGVSFAILALAALVRRRVSRRGR